MSSGCCLEMVIIEDERGICDLAEFIAKDIGCRVYKAHSLAEGLEQLKQHPNVRLGVFDYHLPDSHEGQVWGHDLGQYLKSKPEIQYYLITGDIDVTREIAQKLGAVDVIHKPVTSEEFQRLLKNFIRQNHRLICSSDQQRCPNA